MKNRFAVLLLCFMAATFSVQAQSSQTLAEKQKEKAAKQQSKIEKQKAKAATKESKKKADPPPKPSEGQDAPEQTELEGLVPSTPAAVPDTM